MEDATTTPVPPAEKPTVVDETSNFESTNSDVPVFDEPASPKTDSSTSADADAIKAQDADTQTDGTGDDTAASEKAKKPNRVQKRIDQVVREREDAKRKAEKLEARIAELEAKKTESQKAKNQEPSEDDFETHEEYLDALTAHEDRIESLQQETKAQEPPIDDNAPPALSDAQKTAMAIFKEKIDADESLPEDFQDVVQSESLDITGPMLEALALVESPGELTYHLGKNPELASEIAAGSYAEQVSAIATLNLQFAKPKKPVDLPKGPDPIDPVGSNFSAPAKNIGEMSFSEYEKSQNKREQVGARW